MKRFAIILVTILSLLLITGCTNEETTTHTARPTKPTTVPITARPTKPTTVPVVFEKGEKPQYEIKLSNGKSIKVELYPDIAPITVTNFANLVNQKFYDGIVFHRIIANFMIQTGGFVLENAGTSKEKLTEKEAETIKGEFSLNNVENNIEHLPGVISMARATSYNSASSQFFICVDDERASLDGSYAAFGKTIDEDSLNNAIEISKVSTTSKTFNGTKYSDFPVKPIFIESIRRIDK